MKSLDASPDSVRLAEKEVPQATLSRAASRWWLGAAIVAGAGEVALMRLSAAPGGILDRRFGLFWNIAAAWVLFIAAAGCLYRVRSTRTVVLVAIVFGVLLRVAAISPKAPLSDDLYRYAWDGTVQTNGTDPYRYAPLAPQLETLRTPWLFPESAPNGTQINRPDVRTIYPPVAEAWFTAIHVVVPTSLQDRGFETVGLLTELAVLAVLLALLRAERRRNLVLYALCPLPILEAVQNAHVDGLAVLFILLTILAVRRERFGWATLWLAAATLVKLYPALLLPILLRPGSWRDRLQRLGLFGGLMVAAYLPHVVAVGPKVLGYLPGYLKEEQYGTGRRFQLVGLLGLHGRVAAAVVVTALVAVAVGVFASRLEAGRAALYLIAASLLLATPVQPWYALGLVALVALTGEWWWLGIGAAMYVLFFGVILDRHPTGYGQIAYGTAAILALVGALTTRNRVTAQ